MQPCKTNGARRPMERRERERLCHRQKSFGRTVNALKFLGPTLILVVLAEASFARKSASPDIWFAPLQPTLRTDGSEAGAADFFSLFEADAPWKFASHHIAVFKIYPELLQNASDDELRRLISGLAERHIALALETPVLADTIGCGPGGEHQRWMVGLVERLKRLGGQLNALAMVGPLVDGHASTKDGACHRPIPDVVQDAVRTIAAIRKFYPDLTVGEIEPLGSGANYPNWAELRQWFATFETAYGRPIAFFHLDVEWGADWRADLIDVARQTRSAGIRFGVIYDGTPMDLSGATFSRESLLHADEVEAALGRPPDQIIIQSWQDYPRRVLPDRDPATMTGIVRAYVRQRALLVRISPHRVQLVNDDGLPIADAQILVEAHDSTPGSSLESRTMEGTVPHAATRALFALRIHAECPCSPKPMKLWITGFEFSQSSAATHSHQELQTGVPEWYSADTHRPLALSRFEVAAGQPFFKNGSTFPVTADAPFVATFAWQVEPEGEDTGSINLIFLGANGSEVRRTFLMLKTSWIEIARLRTGPDGSVNLPRAASRGSKLVRIRFAGDLGYRAAVETI
jgi:hypothetical protein